MGELRTCPGCFERVDSVRDRWALVRLGGGPLRKRCPKCNARVELRYGGAARTVAAAVRKIRGLDPPSNRLLGLVALAAFVLVALAISRFFRVQLSLAPIALLAASSLLAALTVLAGRVEVAPAADESPAEYLVSSLRDVTDDRRAW